MAAQFHRTPYGSFECMSIGLIISISRRSVAEYIYGPPPNPKRPSARLASFAFLFFFGLLFLPRFCTCIGLPISVIIGIWDTAADSHPTLHGFAQVHVSAVHYIDSRSISVGYIYICPTTQPTPPTTTTQPESTFRSPPLFPDAGPPRALCPGHHGPCQSSVSERAQIFVGVQHRVPRENNHGPIRTGRILAGHVMILHCHSFM